MSTIDFQEFLMRDEKLIWSGVPARGLVLTGRDVFLIPLSLVFGGVILAWEVSALDAPKAPIFVKLWGIPFMLFALYFILGRFFLDARIRAGLRYAITNKRVLISRSSPSKKSTALSLNRLPDMNLIQGSDGRGTIRFGEHVSILGSRNTFAMWTPVLDPTPQFFMIENVANVFEQLQRAVQNAA